MWKKIVAWLKERGATLRKYKFTLYLAFSLAAMIGLVNIFWISPLMASIIIMGFGVLKQLLWDVVLHHQKFDWIDLVWMLAGCVAGFLMTGAWYKIN